MGEIQELTKKIKKFTEDRDWDQFHNPKDLAIAISIEANELLECFLWKSHNEANPEKLKEELADILNYAFLLAEKLQLDPLQIVEEKMNQNAVKYPIEKARGTAKKYNEL